ncbi:hypothetical protein ACTXK0_10690 [Corynebacterium variabile]|nr:hypothetical protein [Corynebacterium variabile]
MTDTRPAPTRRRLDAAADNGGTAECQVPAGVPDASDEEPMSVEEFMAQ